MKKLLLIAPVLILIVGITPTASLILAWIQGDTTEVLLAGIVYSLIFIGAFVVLVTIARAWCRVCTQPLYYILGSLVFACTVSYGYRTIYTLASLIGVEQILFTVPMQVSVVAVWCTMIVWSIYNFHKPQTVKKISIHSPHVDQPISFVYLADIQFGSTNKLFLEKTITLVNSLQPEFIMFGGDLVDFDHYEESDFEILHTLKVPMYFITGNHEYYHQAERILSFIKKYSKIIIMDNKKIITDSGIEVIGVDYRHAKSQTEYETILDDLTPSPDRFSVFMFHEPKRVESTALRGYDLQLYGHTHGGQIFPGNLIAKSVYGSFAYGLTLLEKTNTRVYTTFGAGLWGPRMRLATENEVVVFTVEPKK